MCGLFEFVIKVDRVGGWVLGFVGDIGQIVALVEWVAWFYKTLTRDDKFLAWVGIGLKLCMGQSVHA